MTNNRFQSLKDIWRLPTVREPAVLNVDGSLTDRKFLFDVAQEISREIEGKSVAIFCNSTKFELIGVLAALKSAARIILPPNAMIGSLKEIESSFDILLTDMDFPSVIKHLNIAKPELIAEAIASGSNAQEFEKRDVDLRKQVVFFTSGSSGAPKEVPKYLYQLDNEVCEWEKLLAVKAGDAEIHATVSHQHIYGLLFRILWPLCTGRLVADQLCQNWEEVVQSTENRGPFILFSSPTHLCRLEGLLSTGAVLKPVFTFSSGGILPTEDAANASKALSGPIQEIYGSTETGGIARRFSSGAEESWEPLPTAQISQDERGCLQVSSAFISEDDPVFQTEDLCEISETGHFFLKGRADRIVKVEGKRVSLPRLEELLRRHEWVQDVHVRLLEGNPPVLGAAIELRGEGLSYLSEMGSFRAGRFFRKYLADYEDAVATPRKWKFPDQLPRNAQGKLSASDMMLLFNDNAVSSTEEKNINFHEIARETTENTLSITFVAPGDLEYFKGHFTNEPVLAGVVQVHWATQQAIEYFKITSVLNSVDKLKFKHFIFPDKTVLLELKNTKPGQITFRYVSHGADGYEIDHSSGILKFESESA